MAAAKKKDFTSMKIDHRGADLVIPAGDGTQDSTIMEFKASGLKPGSRVSSAIAQATGRKGQQTTATPQEQTARAEAMKTQGRKGCKAVRINMAFSSSNHRFIKIMARASGRTMTEMVNLIIAGYQREHPELMDQAEVFIHAVNSSTLSDLLGGENDN